MTYQMNENEKIEVVERKHIRSLHLHLGAHKTASTHLQSLFSETASDPYYNKVHYIGPQVLREVTRGSKSKRFNNLEPMVMKLIPLSDKEILLISDENMLGTLGQFVRTGKFYGEAHKNLFRYSFFSNNFDNITIWLTIRDVESFKKSAYIEILNWQRQKFAKKILDVAMKNEDWLDLINAIREVFPTANINILLYEKYRENVQLLMNNIFETEVQLSSDSVQSVNRQKIKPSFVKLILLMDIIYTPFYIRKKLIHLIQRINGQLSKKKTRKVQNLNSGYHQSLGKNLRKSVGVNLFGKGWDA